MQRFYRFARYAMPVAVFGVVALTFWTKVGNALVDFFEACDIWG